MPFYVYNFGALNSLFYKTFNQIKVMSIIHKKNSQIGILQIIEQISTSVKRRAIIFLFEYWAKCLSNAICAQPNFSVKHKESIGKNNIFFVKQKSDNLNTKKLKLTWIR